MELNNVHLSSLFSFSGDQFSWLKEDLEKFDRSVTPWLVAAWHPPWYNSYSSHYQEFECMRLQMEELLYQYGVDIVFSGHVSFNLVNSWAIYSTNLL